MTNKAAERWPFLLRFGMMQIFKGARSMGLKDRDYMQERKEIRSGKNINSWGNSGNGDLKVKDAVFWCSIGLNVVLVIALMKLM